MIQFMRGTKSQLNNNSSVIAAGQPVFESDTGQLKIGNGSSRYSALEYVGSIFEYDPSGASTSQINISDKLVDTNKVFIKTGAFNFNMTCDEAYSNGLYRGKSEEFSWTELGVPTSYRSTDFIHFEVSGEWQGIIQQYYDYGNRFALWMLNNSNEQFYAEVLYWVIYHTTR